jgi:hypothetical protein
MSLRHNMERYFGSMLKRIQPGISNMRRNKFYDVTERRVNVRPVLTQSYKEVGSRYKIKKYDEYTNAGLTTDKYNEFSTKHHIGIILNRDHVEFKEFEFFPYLSCMTSINYNFSPHRSNIWTPLIRYPTCDPSLRLQEVSYNLSVGESCITHTRTALSKKKRQLRNNIIANTLMIPKKVLTVRISYNKWPYLPVKDLIRVIYNYNVDTYKEMAPMFNTIEDAICFLIATQIRILIIVDDDVSMINDHVYDFYKLSNSGVGSVIFDNPY